MLKMKLLMILLKYNSKHKINNKVDFMNATEHHFFDFLR